jgi:S-adenosylmethionine synthetase
LRHKERSDNLLYALAARGRLFLDIHATLASHPFMGNFMAEKNLFTSESVTEGHPDKVADAISDSVVDAIMEEDPNGRVACETLVTTGMALLAGEITTEVYVDIPKLARTKLSEIGYTDAAFGLDCETCAVITSIDEQSPDIAMGVDRKSPEEQGAGDQGLMFGYASDENDQYMPTPIHLAHRLAERLAAVRKNEDVSYLRPDGKTQVTVEYVDGRPVRVDTVVVSTQHGPDTTLETIREDMVALVAKPILEASGLDYSDVRYFVNPTGRFVLGGPHADCGLTGRKIIVDTYGGMGRHGGGAFSGKDPSKVDRSASYAARWVAKNLVAAGAAERMEVQLAYAIGVAQPVSVRVESFGTARVPEDAIVAAVRELWDLTPNGIIEGLQLRRGIYGPTAAYGHFGRSDASFSWEALDRVDAVKAQLGL